MTDVQDRIEREVVVGVPPAQAWPALVEPELVGQWFGKPSQRLESGIEVELVFELAAGTQRGRAQVLEVREGEFVSFRWLPGPAAHWDGVLDRSAPLDELPTTLVELRMEPANDGRATRIVVTESGFAALPVQVAAQVLADNTGGWEHCFTALGRMFEPSVVGS